jgi:hypothetical protein
MQAQAKRSGGQGQGQDRQRPKPEGLAKRGWETEGADWKTAVKLERKRRTVNKQTENTGVNTQGIIGRWETPGGSRDKHKGR